jgi:hypothetical protein
MGKVKRLELWWQLYLYVTSGSGLRKNQRSLYVRLSVQLGCHWADFHTVWYFIIFRTSVEKIKVTLKSFKDNGYFTRRPVYIYGISFIFLGMRNVWDKVLEKMRTHILHSIIIFRKSCCLWDYVEKYGTTRQATDDNIIWRLHSSCWITKARDTHSEY